jgi:hypothetical protein
LPAQNWNVSTVTTGGRPNPRDDHIEANWFPNLAGTEQVRDYLFDGDELVLDADTAWDKVPIIWRRMPTPG